MNNQTAYWLWIQQLVGYSNGKISKIMKRFTFAEDFYRASLEEKMLCGCFAKKDVYNLENLSLGAAESIMRRCRSCGIDIVAIGDGAYPESLREIQFPPVVLYVRGNADILSDNFSIGIVGTRNATQTGRETAFRFGYELAKSGAAVVSGGAVGIDNFAHSGALRADGKTICVLGCGHEYNYLSSFNEMKKQILKRGAVVSEYPPDYPSAKGTFPKRNRIISGLSKGVLVVEAGEKSGSFITADYALKQKKMVFLIKDGNLLSSPETTGRLVRKGAICVSEPKEIVISCSENDVIKLTDTISEPKQKLVDYKDTPTLDIEGDYEKINISNLFGEKLAEKSRDGFGASGEIKNKSNLTDNVSDNNLKKRKYTEPEKSENNYAALYASDLPAVNMNDYENLSEKSKLILKSFDGVRIHIDSIADKTGLTVREIHSAMFELEIGGFVKSLEGRRYELLVSV